MISKIQTALKVVYPPRCVNCGDMVDSDFGLCGKCWVDTPFIGGLVCDACGTPLPGSGDGHRDLCDDCLAHPRAWQSGRAAVIYEGVARKLVLALKHGDRHDIARPAAKWMAAAARPILVDTMIIAPVPLHWRRMVARRFNQAAVLARALSEELGLPWCPDLLQRHRHTASTQGLGQVQRHESICGAIRAHPRRLHRIAGRPVLLIDDVMTTGATFSAATAACRAARAAEVHVLALARVANDA